MFIQHTMDLYLKSKSNVLWPFLIILIAASRLSSFLFYKIIEGILLFSYKTLSLTTLFITFFLDAVHLKELGSTAISVLFSFILVRKYCITLFNPDLDYQLKCSAFTLLYCLAEYSTSLLI